MIALRVTSSKTRKMIFVVGDGLELGFTPENLELYLPNGTPLNLSKDATRMLWRGEWANDQYYEQNDVVIDEGDLFILKALGINPGGVSPSLENLPPGSVIETRTSHAYASTPYDTPDTPIIIRDVPFTDLASAPILDIWIGGGSKALSFDAEPNSSVTVTTVGGQIIGFQDTGVTGAGNSEVGGTSPHNSPWTFVMPAAGRMTLEVSSTTTEVVVSGVGVTYDHTNTVVFPGSSGGIAFPLINGERIYPKGQPIFYFDLTAGGTVTITEPATGNSYLQLYDSTGTPEIGSNYPLPGFNGALVKTDLAPGRYFFRAQEAIYLDPPPIHVYVVPSDGATLATFDPDIKFWDVLFRASSGPTGSTGPTGAAGAAGATGAAGADGDDGADGTSFFDAWKGDWVAGAYSVGDVVRHTSGLFIVTTAATSADEPGVASNWELMVQGV